MTVQARRAGDAALRNTTVAVRLCTSHEQCAVLNGSLGGDREHRTMYALERFALRHADLLLSAAPEVLASYERFYGAAALATAVRVHAPVRLPVDEIGPPPPADGLLLADASEAAIATAVRDLVEDRAPLVDRISDGRAWAHLARLADDDDTIRFYAGVAHGKPVGVHAGNGSVPLVSVVLVYGGQHDAVEGAVGAALQQTHAILEVIVVNDGWWRAEDAVLETLADGLRVRVVHQPRSGPGQARTLGARMSRGRYVVLIEADTVLAPSYTERCLAALAGRPDAAWAASWVAYHDGGETHPLAGAATGVALIRRPALENRLPFDPDLVVPERPLLDALPGVIVPAVLVEASRTDEEAGDERDARAKEAAIRWTATA